MNKCTICGKELKFSSKTRKYCYDCRKNIVLKKWVEKSIQKRKLLGKRK